MISSKYTRILLPVLLAAILLLAACAPAQTSTPAPSTTTSATEREPVRIAALKGPTGIGLVKLMTDQDSAQTANDYTFSLFGSPDDIVAQITSGQADIAALPTNLAAVLYQKTNQKIHMLAVNTLGVLYILEKGDTIHSLSDLSGKTLLATGQGSVPEYVINELIAQSGLTGSVKIEYKAEHSELATLAVAGQADLVMLPEPFVTTVLSKNNQFRIAVDLTTEWSRVQAAAGKPSEMSMGCLVVTDAFAKDHPEALSKFMTEYQASAAYVNAQPAEAGKAVAQFGIMADAGLAAKAIPNCHIVMIRGQEMQETLAPFFEILLAANPKSIGGKLPDQNFYWIQ